GSGASTRPPTRRRWPPSSTSPWGRPTPCASWRCRGWRGRSPPPPPWPTRWPSCARPASSTTTRPRWPRTRPPPPSTSPPSRPLRRGRPDHGPAAAGAGGPAVTSVATPAEPGWRADDTGLLRSTVGITAGNLVSRLTGFVRVLAVAAALGTTYLGNTYQTANL